MSMESSTGAMEIIKAIGARDRIIRDLVEVISLAIADLEGIETEHSMYPTLMKLKAARAAAGVQP